MNSKNLMATVALLATLVGVLATSRRDETIGGSSFYILSDCGNAVQEANVLTNGFPPHVISSGAQWDTFGFPTGVQLDFVNEVSGVATGGVNRSCAVTYGGQRENADEIIYSCFDNGSFSCSILIREN